MKKSRRALVTGATGFIGKHLVRHLRDAGWEVHAILRRMPEEPTPAGPDRFHLYSGSTDDVMAAVRACCPDVTFHLASLFLASHTPDQVAGLVESNLLFGTQILEAVALQQAGKVVNTGTSWQYFHSPSYRPVNLYAATKQAFEDILKYYVDAATLNAVSLNLFDSYGPGDTRPKLLRLLIHTLRSQTPLQMSAGEQMIDLVHVDDICRAYLQAAELLLSSALPAGSSFAVSGGQRRTLRGIVETFEQEAGKRLPIEWGARPYREREVMQLWDGPQLPGWFPSVKLADGMRAILQAEGITE